MEEDAMVWEPEIEELERRRAWAAHWAARSASSSSTTRASSPSAERIDLLADPGTFREFGVMAGTADYEGNELAAFRPQPFVIGLVEVDDARSSSVVATTRRAGGAGANDRSVSKSAYAEKMALASQCRSCA